PTRTKTAPKANAPYWAREWIRDGPAYPPACAVATVVPPCRGSTGAVGGTRAASLPRMAAVTQPSWPGGRAPLRCGRADAPVVRGLRRRRPPVAGPVLVGGDGLAG